MTKRKTVTQGYVHEVDELDMLGGQDRAPPPPVVAGNVDAAELERNRLLNLPVKP
jgi:hypothetical protein